MVGDMSRVTLNLTLTYQKFLLCVSSQGPDLYSHQKLNMYIYGSHLRVVTDANDDDDADNDNAGRHSTTTRVTYRQLLDTHTQRSESSV